MSRLALVAGIVEVLPATRRRPRLVQVRCPLCHRLHLHGWPGGDATPYRSPHCAQGPAAVDYLVTDPDGLLTGRAEP